MYAESRQTPIPAKQNRKNFLCRFPIHRAAINRGEAMQRNTFFDDMQRMSFEELKQKYAAPIKLSFVTKVKRKAKKAIKKVLRVIGGAEHEHSQEYGLLFVFRV